MNDIFFYLSGFTSMFAENWEVFAFILSYSFYCLDEETGQKEAMPILAQGWVKNGTILECLQFPDFGAKLIRNEAC